MEIQTLTNLVSRLNDLALERTEHLSMSIAPWAFTTDGFIHKIDFLNHPIWDSDSDDREELEPEEYEPLETFLHREVLSLLEMLSCTLRPTDEQTEAYLRTLSLRYRDGRPAAFSVARSMVIVEGGALDQESLDKIQASNLFGFSALVINERAGSIGCHVEKVNQETR